MDVGLSAEADPFLPASAPRRPTHITPTMKIASSRLPSDYAPASLILNQNS